MEISIVGLPLAGKTTVFNALTGSNEKVAAYSTGHCQVRPAVVEVPDPRVDALSQMYNPHKTTRAKIQFNDISGMSKGQAQSGSFDAQLLATMSKSDALLEVMRAFRSDEVPHPNDRVDPAADLDSVRLELILADLGTVERRIERIHAKIKKASNKEKPRLETELALMQRFAEALENEVPIGDLDLSKEEEQMIRGFCFLTAKPAMVVVNLGEDDDPATDLSWTNHHKHTAALALKGALEMEISQLPPDETELFLESYGIEEPSLNVMVRECYQLLGLMSFFTVGEDEVRAWTIHRGDTAVNAAGTIHTDLARGFIRAEVISYDDMIACGSLAEVRQQGKLHLKGKDYIVQDGDILNIRFNV